ncbi:uncharacterized protein ATC70_001812 [Mucor velutinosus]|uniref:Homeobox domain-containing protein n=1 Tax=Mucor velutinosus TaxID=708070 RepID=A0AAN7DC42_9FUNG|nr:hypothetical protein ATC70_001812 [Mucor velutinosus]
MSQLDNCRIRKSSGTNPNQYEDNSSSKNFSPNFYNPFEVKHRRRTSRTQFKILEKAFSSNPKPNSKIRQGLAESLSMTPRGVQVWFQNRRAKEKQVSNHVKKEASHPPKQQHLNYAPITLSASNMVHSRSQSSSSSSTNKPWISDNSTVNDEEEELTTINTPPNNQSSQIPLEGDTEWWLSHAGNTAPFIHHQTTAAAAVTKADPVTTTMSSADSAVNLNAWPATSTYFSQSFLPMTDIHSMASHDCTMRSVPNNSNVVDWIQSTQVMNDNLILDDMLNDSSSKNFNMSHKRYSYPLSMPLQQDETYWTGQQIMRRLSEPSQETSELELMDPYNNTNIQQ